VAQLRSAGYRLGILSNTCPAHWEFVAGRYELLRAYFEPCVLSYEVGVMKPDPAIYQAAAGRAGVPGERIFYCDDHLENVEGARRCGWDAEPFTGHVRLADQLRQRGVAFNY
jgi:HAD superfamily hydrolase (TIGR01549 family)